MALGAGNLYWAQGSSNTLPTAIVDLPLVGGTTATLVTTVNSATTLTADAADVYWMAANVTSHDGAGGPVGSTTLVKEPLGGGVPATLYAGQGVPRDIAVDIQHAYWTDRQHGAIVRVSLDGGATTTLVSGQDSPWAIAVDDTSVYWTNIGTGANGSVVKLTPK
jgi:hypothetical protein